MVRRRWFLFVKDQQNRKVTDRINRYNEGVEGGLSVPKVRDGERDAIPREQTILLQMMKKADSTIVVTKPHPLLRGEVISEVEVI